MTDPPSLRHHSWGSAMFRENLQAALSTHSLYRSSTRALHNGSSICSFSNSVSSRDALTCDDATCLTRCQLALVSNPCHFSRDRIRTLERLAAEQPARSSGWLPFRHVTCGGAPPAQFGQRRLSLRPPRLFVKCDVAVAIALIRSAARTSAGGCPPRLVAAAATMAAVALRRAARINSAGVRVVAVAMAPTTWAAGVICIIRFAGPGPRDPRRVNAAARRNLQQKCSSAQRRVVCLPLEGIS